jgi:hypothetical protein
MPSRLVKQIEQSARQDATANATAICVFPTPGGPQQSGVGLRLDEGEGGTVFDLARVELGPTREVVLIQRLVVRQPGRPQAVAEATAVADGWLLGEDQVEEVGLALVSVPDVLMKGRALVSSS